MYHVSAQGVDECMINVQYYYYYQVTNLVFYAQSTFTVKAAADETESRGRFPRCRGKIYGHLPIAHIKDRIAKKDCTAEAVFARITTG